MATLRRVGSYEVQRNYNFLLYMTSPDNITMPTENLDSLSVPLGDIEPDFHFIGGRKYPLPGFAVVKPMVFNFVETNTGQVYRFIESWKERVLSKEGIYGYPYADSFGRGGFKQNVEVHLLNLQKEVHTKLIFESCWPSATFPTDFTYSESDKVIITQEFQADRVWIDRINNSNESYIRSVISDVFGPTGSTIIT